MIGCEIQLIGRWVGLGRREEGGEVDVGMRQVEREREGTEGIELLLGKIAR
jgi:hypothetical protein